MSNVSLKAECINVNKLGLITKLVNILRKQISAERHLSDTIKAFLYFFTGLFPMKETLNTVMRERI